MTVGRAEDASISINHNSVSRLHCEVHALGDGRFEIVDKGSSNGVRVNGADLRRGIVEPGDVIELGDVKFKFVGAGQIFRPTESQQLSVHQRSRRGRASCGRSAGATRLPFAIFAVVVVAGAIGRVGVHAAKPDAAGIGADGRGGRRPSKQSLDDAKRHVRRGRLRGGARRSSQGAIPESSRCARRDRLQGRREQVGRQSAHRVRRRETDIRDEARLYQRVAQDVGGRRRRAARRPPTSSRCSTRRGGGVRNADGASDRRRQPQPAPRATPSPTSSAAASAKPGVTPTTQRAGSTRAERNDAARHGSSGEARSPLATSAPSPRDRRASTTANGRLALQARRRTRKLALKQQLEQQRAQRPRVGHRDPPAHQHVQRPGRSRPASQQARALMAQRTAQSRQRRPRVRHCESLSQSEEGATRRST